MSNDGWYQHERSYEKEDAEKKGLRGDGCRYMCASSALLLSASEQLDVGSIISRPNVTNKICVHGTTEYKLKKEVSRHRTYI